MEIIQKEITSSTNDDIVELARKGYPAWTTVMANYQTKGRGRRGSHWESPRGHNLLFSVLLRPSANASTWNRIPQISGMHLIETVESCYSPDEGIKIKWPNDLYYYDKKWSGILVESKMEHAPFAVLGIGVNCRGSHRDYPAELQKRVTTLSEIFKNPGVEPMDILIKFLNRISGDLDESIANFPRVLKFANQRDYLFGKQVSVMGEGSQVMGTACGIGPNGELLTMNQDGVVTRIVCGTILEMD